MTLLEVRNRVRLYAPEATTDVLTNANLDKIINDACTDIARKTRAIISYSDTTVVAGTQEYSQPTGCLEVMGVYYGGTGNWEKVPCVTMDWLAHYIEDDWINATGEIKAYYKRIDKIGLYKTPTSAEAGASYLRIYYVAKPSTVSADDNELFEGYDFMEPYIELVVLYCLYQIKGYILGKSQLADGIKAEYLAKIEEAKIALGRDIDFMEPVIPYNQGIGGASLKQNPLEQ